MPFVRTCSRIGCSVPASMTALVRYEAREHELRPLVDQPDPPLVDPCSDHATRAPPRPALGPRSPAHAPAWVDDRGRQGPTGRLGLSAAAGVALRRTRTSPARPV